MKNKRIAPGRRLAPCALALAISLLVSAPVSVSAEVVDRIVAVVNDSVITLSELNAASATAIGGPGNGTTPDERQTIEIKGRILDSLIEQKLVKHAADRAGIEVSEREIDNAMEDVKKQNRMNHEDLLLALARSGLTYREYRDQLREQIRQVKFINKEFRSKINVTDEEMNEYYRRNIDEFYGPQSYDIALILIPVSDETGAQAARQRLKMILDGLAKGEAFGKLARLFSDGPNASSGGEMGVVKSGELDAAIEDAAARLSPGGISQPIQTVAGIYIIKLNSSASAAPRPFEQVKETVRETLFNKSMADRFRFWLEETKRFAHLDVRL